MHKLLLPLLLLSLTLSLTGCQVERNPHAIKIGAQEFKVIGTKRTDSERAKGLMFEKNLADNHGMLFVMPYAEKHGFWMKNTFIPLDMIWISEDLKVVAVKRNAKPCFPPERQPDLCTVYLSTEKAKYIFEVNANTFNGTSGDTVEFKY